MKKRLGLEKFSQIPVLHYKKILFNIYNFNLNNINDQILNTISLYEKILIERTEQQIIMNIIFNENSLDFNNLRKYEDVAWHFYNEGLQTKYINSKDFIISFPQLYGRDRNFNSKEEDIEAIFSLNSGIDEEGRLVSYLEKFNPNSQKIKDRIYNLESIKMDVCLLPRRNNMEILKKSKNINLNNKELNDYYMENFSALSNENINIYKSQNIENKNNEYFDNSDYSPIPIGKFKNTVCGGSFDHAHIGHNLLLTTASLLTSNMLYIGLTSNKMVSKKDEEYILQPFEQREMKIRKVLNHIGYNKNIKITEINDSVGGASKEAGLDSLVLTEESINGGIMVNQERIKNDLKPLNLVKARIVFYKGVLTLDNKISSTKIRKGIKEDASFLKESFDKWNNLTNRLQINNNDSYYWFSLLRDFYSQFWRKYHTMNHIYEFIRIFESLDLKLEDELNFYLAIWFHDVIYVPSRKDNEERSIELFQEFYNQLKIKMNINKEKINNLIIATKYHSLDQLEYCSDSSFFPQNYLNIKYVDEIKLFLDIDMHIFTQEYETYKKNVDKLRLEFILFNDNEWRIGRSNFLNRLIKRKRIFYTDLYYNKFEEIARENIRKDILSISKI